MNFKQNNFCFEGFLFGFFFLTRGQTEFHHGNKHISSQKQMVRNLRVLRHSVMFLLVHCLIPNQHFVCTVLPCLV